jgi:hypothetical protein
MATRITGSGLFRFSGTGESCSMAETQHDIRVADDSTEQAEESREQVQAGAATVARMLANPRRIRRN